MKIRAKDILEKKADNRDELFRVYGENLKYVAEALEQLMQEVPQVAGNYSFQQASKLVGHVLTLISRRRSYL